MADPIVTAAAVFAAAKKAYETYQDIAEFVEGFLGHSEPSPEEQILDRLDILQQEFDAMQAQLDLVFEAVKELVALEQQIYVLELRRDLDQLRGQSRTAVDQVRAWIDGGRTDVHLRAHADNNSRIPANTLLEGNSFFERPDANVSGTVFDHRLAIIAYMYVVTVRFGVIAALNPQYRNSPLARDELRGHVDRLGWVIAEADKAIDPHVGGVIDTEQGMYNYYHQGEDRISGLKEDHYQSGWLPGGQPELDQQKAEASQKVRGTVQHRTGLSDVIALRHNLEFDASDPRVPRWSSWSSIPRGDFGQVRAIRAVSTTPGGASVFWHDHTQRRVRSVSYAPGAAAGWQPPLDAVPAGWAWRLNDAPLGAVSQAPGKATLLFTGGEGNDPMATYTDPSSPTGWLAQPVLLSENYLDFSNIVVPQRDRVALFWEDYSTRAVVTGFRQGDGAWSEPTPVTPPDSCAADSSITAISHGPGGVFVLWQMDERSQRATCYDPRQPQPAWAAPFTFNFFAPTPIRSGIAAVSPRPWALTLFWGDDDGVLWTTHTDDAGPSAGWAAPQAITPQVVVHPDSYLEASATSDGRINVFWAGYNGSVRTTYRDPQTGSWAPWFEISPPQRGRPAFAMVNATPDSTSVFLTDYDTESNPVLKTATLDMRVATPAARIAQAGALINQAVRLWTLPGPAREEAVARALDAVAVAREAVAADQAYAPTLARWLVSPVSGYVAGVGRHDDAIALGEEAVGIYRQLSEAEPDNADRRSKLASALITLAPFYWAKPDRAQAVARAEEAVDLLRPLAERYAKYRPSLAYWLISPVMGYVAGVGRHDDAIALGEEAVGIYRQLSEAEPGNAERRYNLSWALVTLAQIYWNKPDRPKGVARALEATDLIRPLAEENAKYLPTLGDWLIFPVTTYLASTGRREDAIALAREAVDIFTRLSETDPARYGKQLERATARLAELEGV